jgi:hypothetical protein
MSDDRGDALWDAFVTAMLAAGPVAERRSRYGDKPALFTASREITHMETPGVIDPRITRADGGRSRSTSLPTRPSGVIRLAATGPSSP